MLYCCVIGKNEHHKETLFCSSINVFKTHWVCRAPPKCFVHNEFKQVCVIWLDRGVLFLLIDDGATSVFWSRSTKHALAVFCFPSSSFSWMPPSFSASAFLLILALSCAV